MDTPVITNFNTIAPILVQQYESYLPTAFDESMTILQKMNKIIQHLNVIGKASNDLIIQWNEVMEWIMNDGINIRIVERLDEMLLDGSFASIINEVIFADLNDQITQTKNEIGVVDQRNRQSVWNEFETKEINVKWYVFLVPNKADPVNLWDWSLAIQAAIEHATNTCGVVYFPRGTYRVTSTIVINKNAVTFTASMGGNTNDLTKGATILYDGVAGGDLILIGQYGTALSRNPIIIENLILDGGGKARWAIYSNRTNIQSEIKNNLFVNCIGFMKLDSCYYMDIRNNTFRSTIGEVFGVITSAVWAEIAKGLIQINVANNVIFEKNSILRVKTCYNGVYANLIYSNRQESLNIHMNTIEDCTANYLIQIGDTSAGNNLEISHLYIETTNAVCLLAVGGYANGSVEVRHVHVFATHLEYLYRCGSTNYKGEIKSSFIEFRSSCSLKQITLNSSETASFDFTNCFMGVGIWAYTNGVALLEPFDGSDGGHDNRLGVLLIGRNKTYPTTQESYINGLTSMTSGTDVKGAFIDIPYDGVHGKINGKAIAFSRSTGSGMVVQRLRPTSDGVWYVFASMQHTLFLTKTPTDFNTANFATPLCMFTVTGGAIVGSLDYSVKRPRGLYAGVTCLVFRSVNPVNEDVTWKKGDYAQNSNTSELGVVGSKYVIRGWACIAGGRGNLSSWVEDRGITGN